MGISVDDIKKLRDLTGVGLTDAKKALTEAEGDFDKALDDNDGNDGTSFSKATERYGDYLSRLVHQAGYEDLLLMNLEGDVVFSAYKGVDLGTNGASVAAAHVVRADEDAAYESALGEKGGPGVVDDVPVSLDG